MNLLKIILIISQLMGSVLSFPGTPLYAMFSGLNLTEYKIIQSTIETGSSIYLYIMYASNDYSKLGIMRYNISSSSPVLLKHESSDVGGTAQNPQLVYTGADLMLSYDLVGSSSKLVRFKKDDLSQVVS